MFEPIADFILDGLQATMSTAKALALPAIYFFLLGLILKRRQLFVDLKRVRHEAELNLQIILFDLFFVVPVIGWIAVGLNSVFDTYSIGLVPDAVWAGMPVLVVYLIAVVAGDFIGYWRHRLEHTTILWPSHAVHHSDTQMTWLTLQRFHPINRVTTFTVDSAFLLALSLPPEAVIANNLVRHFYGYFIHADLPWTYGVVGKVLVSPAMHRWHHAADPRFFQKNFATVFSIYDRAFGTYMVPGPCTAPLGVTDNMKPTLLGNLGYAFTPRAYSRLFCKKRK